MSDNFINYYYYTCTVMLAFLINKRWLRHAHCVVWSFTRGACSVLAHV